MDVVHPGATKVCRQKNGTHKAIRKLRFFRVIFSRGEAAAFYIGNHRYERKGKKCGELRRRDAAGTGKKEGGRRDGRRAGKAASAQLLRAVFFGMSGNFKGFFKRYGVLL